MRVGVIGVGDDARQSGIPYVTVRLQHGGRVVNGVGADPDIIVASAKAYLAALNKLHSKTERVAAQG